MCEREIEREIERSIRIAGSNILRDIWNASLKNN